MKQSPDAKHPINEVQWIEVGELSANDYNPNHVYDAEMKLLEHSLLTNGWIQPVLITQDKVIIDGFHRSTLARTSKKIQEKFGTKIPCCVLELTEPERKMLTIRINRAKGSHAAFKMSDIVKSLSEEHGLSDKEIMAGIGADKYEIELLKQDSVFKKLGTAEHQYSKAWYPK